MSLHVCTYQLPLCQFSSSCKVDPKQRRDAVDNQELERLLGHLGSETKKKTELNVHEYTHRRKQSAERTDVKLGEYKHWKDVNRAAKQHRRNETGLLKGNERTSVMQKAVVSWHVKPFFDEAITYNDLHFQERCLDPCRTFQQSEQSFPVERSPRYRCSASTKFRADSSGRFAI
jgi:hypothetical protein